jgi:hypothetical protein
MGSAPSKPPGSRRSSLFPGTRRSRGRSTVVSAQSAQQPRHSVDGELTPEQDGELRHALSNAMEPGHEDGDGDGDDVERVDLERLVAWVERNADGPATEFAATVLRLALQQVAVVSVESGAVVVPYSRVAAAVFALSSGASDAAKGRLLYAAMRGGGGGGGGANGGMVGRAMLKVFVQHTTPWLTPAEVATVVRSAIPDPNGGLSDADVAAQVGRGEVVPRLCVDVV